MISPSSVLQHGNLHSASPTANVPSQTPYDRVVYPSRPFRNTQPHYLATVAHWYGMTPAPPSKCRVLELGCGSGGNLAPMAYRSPESEFVGIDLSRRAIESGRAMIRALGLTNISVHDRDIMDLSEADGRFDYIIAHGVYSWVPQVVRDKILSVFESNLSPQGIAYVSYNTLPGAHLRTLARSMMLYHVRNICDPAAKIAQSRALIKSIADASDKNSVYGVVLRDQLHRIGSVSDEVFVHDDLDEGSTPFFLHQIVEAAARHGLQYLADSDFPVLGLQGRSPEIRSLLSAIPEQEAALRDQYADFIDGRVFRSSLFCHQNVFLSRPPKVDRIKTLHLSGALAADVSRIDPASEDAVVFKTPSGETLRTNQPLGKAALLALADAHPEVIGFDELVVRASERLGKTSLQSDADEIDALSKLLFQAVRANLLDSYYEMPRLTNSISVQPKASGFARWQLSTGSNLVTNLLHGAVLCEDDTLRRFIPLLDGTRNLADLREDMKRNLQTSPAASGANVDELTRTEALQQTLNVMAKLALLEC
jgi:methyltransferase-like protein/2-polyprenyl-3-methyl-5-hydroxy-6-metoxy-1,4-benzoquinol methylase